LPGTILKGKVLSRNDGFSSESKTLHKIFNKLLLVTALPLHRYKKTNLLIDTSHATLELTGHKNESLLITRYFYRHV